MSSQSSGSGVGFVGLLQLLFIGLKLTGSITWSWWWVMSPVWVPALAIVLILVAGGACYVTADKK